MKQLDVSKTARLEAHVRARLEAKTLVGMAAGVWQNNQCRYSLVCGMRDLENKVAMTRDTMFRMASMTKPVTGISVMRQVENGKLGLDDEISRWLPGFADMQVAVATPEGDILQTRPAQKPLTVRMLLTHSNGLGAGAVGDKQWVAKFRPILFGSLAAAVDAYPACILDFQPGTAQWYSPVMAMDVLVRLVELTSDMPYAEYVQKYLFDAMEMPDTTYRPTPAQQPRVMEMYDAKPTGIVHTPIDPESGFGDFPKGYTGGGAGLFSTLDDYSHLAQMLANDGVYGDTRILKKETVDVMATPQLPPEFYGITPYFNWGLSMRVCPTQNAPSQPLSGGSFGWSGAYGTHFWVDRSRQLYAVYMSNLLDGGGSGAATAFEFERDVMYGFDECE